MSTRSEHVDLGGLDIVCRKIFTGANATEDVGTELTSSNLATLTGVVAGTASASKAVVLDASKDIAGLGVVGTTRIDWDSGTGTTSAHAVTVTKWANKITTEALTTAHTASETIVVTKTGVAAGDLCSFTFAGGTNSQGIPNLHSVVCTTDTVTIVIKNEALTTNAFNGTLIFDLIIWKA